MIDIFTKGALWDYWKMGGDEIEVSDDESSDLEKYWSDKEEETAEIFKIETDVFDYETPLCLAFNEFNYLLKVDPDLLTNWREDGYCNGGNLPDAYHIGNSLHYQDLKNIQRTLRTASSGTIANVQCYNCSEKAHYARNLIMEYLVNISKRRAFWSLNEDILKITILTTNKPYPSRRYGVSVPALTKDHKGLKINTPYPEKTNTPYWKYGMNKIFWKISNVVPTPRNSNTPYLITWIRRRWKITTWEELVETFFYRFYPESYDGEDEMLDEGNNWGIDPLEFLSNVNTSFKNHKKIDGRTKKVLFHAWMNGNWNKRRMDNSILSSNNTTDSFFKPYLITRGKNDTEKEDEQSQTKHKYSNTSNHIDEQPNKRMYKAEKFKLLTTRLDPTKNILL
ncbi:hypothetical protein Tco_0838391 [Tanacetum coccineum]|uniref:Protein TIC 214 n=1 Tax=Tanacetum coccineum TaxID=301880 RepID=A0ABQ5AS72_9ASTR